jgi:hypothetical protein
MRLIEGGVDDVTECGSVNISSGMNDRVGSKSTTGRDAPTVTADDCRAHVSECLRLRNTGTVSARRVTALMRMMATWIVLANQIERFEAIVRDEDGRIDR